MYREHIKQQGFAVVEGLLFVVIVALLAGVGYYVWHSTNQTNKTLDLANNQKFAAPAKKSSSSNKSSTSSSTSTTNSNAGYLVIKEWGVKLPLSSAITGAYYKYDSSTSMGGVLYDGVSIYDTAVDQITNANGVSCKNTDLLDISRAKTSDVPSLLNPSSPNFISDTGPSNFKTFTFTSQYEFAAMSSHQAEIPCEAQNKTGDFIADPQISAKISAAESALSVAFNNMQAQ